MNNISTPISVLQELQEVNQLEMQAHGWSSDDVSGNREENQAYGTHKVLNELLTTEQEDLVGTIMATRKEVILEMEIGK